MTDLITDHMDIWTDAQIQKATGGRGRGKNGNGQPIYGIKKLRELILELAVRGKLVPQDPGDEPASILLEKIAEEKKRLIKEGKIKKQKKLPEIGEDEKRFELPDGWEWVRLGSGLKKITDGTHHSPPNGENGDYLYISAKNIKPEGVLLANATYVSREIHDEIYARCDPEYGDILYIKDGATTGIATINKIEEPFSMLSSVALLKAPECILNTYLLLSLSSPLFYEEMRSGMTGVAITRVTLRKLNNAQIPLPPIAEQHRIVAKVDELMALCDQLEQQQTDNNATHQTLVETLLTTLTTAADPKDFDESWQRIANHFDTLFTTEQSIDHLKQTILQLAVMGRLVPQDPDDEPASVLLEKIAKEKARLVKEGKIKMQKKLPEIGEDERPFELPEGWEWTRFGKLVHHRLGKMLDKAKNKGTLKPYLRNTNVQWNMFDLTDLKEMRFEESELDEFRVQNGDLLICEGGEPGRCAIWRKDNTEIYFQKALHRVRTFCGLKSEYLLLNLFNSALNGDLSHYFTGATIKHLPGEKLLRYVLPAPPIGEQNRIVAKVDELMAICDTLKTRLNDAQTTQVELADAIVEQAVA